MSTRCNIHFSYSKGEEYEANIYRHCDGYPSAILPDLGQFFDDVQAKTPRRTDFDDPMHLAAKFIVWTALRRSNPLDVTVAPTMGDAEDGEYVYDVRCSSEGRPTVRWRRAGETKWLTRKPNLKDGE